MLVSATLLLASLVNPQGSAVASAPDLACLEESIAHLGDDANWRVRRIEELRLEPQSAGWAMVELVRDTNYRFVACNNDGTTPIEVVLYNNRTEHLHPSRIRGQHSHLDFDASYTAPFFVGVQTGAGETAAPMHVTLLVIEQ